MWVHVFTPGPVSSLKSLKLARLGRIIRLLKFKIFQELKLMIQGVFTGLRVLFWAVVLLFLCMYLLGIVTTTLFKEFAEFSSVPAAMFTWFRCFTDGCAAYDGTPLQEKLRHASWLVLLRYLACMSDIFGCRYLLYGCVCVLVLHRPSTHMSQEFGGVFMVVYILLFLFVTIGIFNLIMAPWLFEGQDVRARFARQLVRGIPEPGPIKHPSRLSLSIMLPMAARRNASDNLAKTPQRRSSLPWISKPLCVCVCVCFFDTIGLQDLSRIALQWSFK